MRNEVSEKEGVNASGGEADLYPLSQVKNADADPKNSLAQCALGMGTVLKKEITARGGRSAPTLKRERENGPPPVKYKEEDLTSFRRCWIEARYEGT